MIPERNPIAPSSSTTLITGAASGIGRALAIELLRQGETELILVDKDLGPLQQLQEQQRPRKSELPSKPDVGRNRILTCACDISSAESVAQLVTQLQGTRLDILINCAGVTALGTFESIPFETFERIIHVNLLGTARLTRALLPLLLKSPKACIVNVASLAGLLGAPGMCAYSASKFGLIGMSQALSLELQGRVHLCTVCPSFVKSGIVRGMHQAEATLNRLGADPTDVARQIIRAVNKKKSLVLLGKEAFFFHYLSRLSPWLATRLIRLGYAKLLQSATIPS